MRGKWRTSETYCAPVINAVAVVMRRDKVSEDDAKNHLWEEVLGIERKYRSHVADLEKILDAGEVS
jgi:hypothetical protein